WQSNSFKLPPATNSLKWRYWMTNFIAPGVSLGQSAGWVDQVAFSPGDTTPPTVLFTFTNLTLAAVSNCQTALPCLTGTNLFQAADNCSSVTVTQTPLAGTLLPLGTNQVVLTARDASGNAVRSTNTVVIADLTPPVIAYYFTNLTLSSGSNCQALLPNLTG